MPTDIFMVIPPSSTNPPITADPVQDEYFKSAFGKAAVVPIRQFSLDVENATTVGSASGGAGMGKAKLNPVTIVKSVDTVSRSLFSIAASGGHLATMQLYLRKPGAVARATAGRPYLAYEFSMVFITKIDWSADSGDEGPLEHVTFAYGALALGYYQQKPDGTLGKPVEAGWDQVANAEPKQDMLAGF
jgi:type VI secretion system secreted protein Hcp